MTYNVFGGTLNLALSIYLYAEPAQTIHEPPDRGRGGRDTMVKGAHHEVKGPQWR